MKEYTIALVGDNDLVKDNVFNTLVGWNQKTTPWPNHSFDKQEGKYLHGEVIYHFINLPSVSCLSLDSDAAKLTLDFIRQENTHATIIVSDENQLSLNLPLISDVLNNTTKSILCINAKKKRFKKYSVNEINPLTKWISLPIIVLHKKEKQGFVQLIDCLDQLLT